MKVWELKNKRWVLTEEATAVLLTCKQYSLVFLLYTLVILGRICFHPEALFEECGDSCPEISSAYFKIMRWFVFLNYLLSCILIIIYLMNTNKNEAFLRLSTIPWTFGILMHLAFAGVLSQVKYKKSALYTHLWIAIGPSFLCLYNAFYLSEKPFPYDPNGKKTTS